MNWVPGIGVAVQWRRNFGGGNSMNAANLVSCSTNNQAFAADRVWLHVLARVEGTLPSRSLSQP